VKSPCTEEEVFWWLNKGGISIGEAFLNKESDKADRLERLIDLDERLYQFAERWECHEMVMSLRRRVWLEFVAIQEENRHAEWSDDLKNLIISSANLRFLDQVRLSQWENGFGLSARPYTKEAVFSVIMDDVMKE